MGGRNEGLIAFFFCNFLLKIKKTVRKPFEIHLEKRLNPHE